MSRWPPNWPPCPAPVPRSLCSPWQPGFACQPAGQHVLQTLPWWIPAHSGSRPKCPQGPLRPDLPASWLLPTPPFLIRWALATLGPPSSLKTPAVGPPWCLCACCSLCLESCPPDSRVIIPVPQGFSQVSPQRGLRAPPPPHYPVTLCLLPSRLQSDPPSLTFLTALVDSIRHAVHFTYFVDLPSRSLRTRTLVPFIAPSSATGTVSGTQQTRVTAIAFPPSLPPSCCPGTALTAR